MVDYSQKEAAETSKRSIEAAHSGEMVIIVLSVVSLGLAIGISMLIISSLMSGVHALRDGMNRFVDTKDLNFKIKYDGKDEIGEIVTSFNKLLDTLESTIKDAKSSSSENASVSSELSSTSMQIGKNAEEGTKIVEETIREISKVKNTIEDSAHGAAAAKIEI